VLQEEEDETYLPKISFESYEEAKEFITFASNKNLIIVTTSEVKNYFLGYKENERLF
jgi:SepF-like predicted cell division protein (DUF552 family)